MAAWLALLLLPLTPRAHASRFSDAERILRDQAESAVVRSEDNRPIVRTHGRKTRKVAVLVHGLSDSPCSMQPAADLLFSQGYNVVTVLLDGHGTRPEDLRTVDREQWRHGVYTRLALARYLGDEITLAGFSTGGALALSALVHNAAMERVKVHARAEGLAYIEPFNIKELILFSPALGVGSALARSLCRIPGAVAAASLFIKDVPGVNPSSCKYDRIALNAACQVDRLAQENKRRLDYALDEIRAKGIRTLLAFWEGDQVIRVVDIELFEKQLPKDRTSTLRWAAGDKPPQGHNIAVELPRLPKLEDALTQFAQSR